MNMGRLSDPFNTPAVRKPINAHKSVDVDPETQAAGLRRGFEHFVDEESHFPETRFKNSTIIQLFVQLELMIKLTLFRKPFRKSLR